MDIAAGNWINSAPPPKKQWRPLPSILSLSFFLRVCGCVQEQVNGFPALKDNEKFVINPRCEAKPKRDQFPTTTPPPQKKEKKKKSKKKEKKAKKDKKNKKKKNNKG